MQKIIQINILILGVSRLVLCLLAEYVWVKIQIIKIVFKNQVLKIIKIADENVIMPKHVFFTLDVGLFSKIIF